MRRGEGKTGRKFLFVDDDYINDDDIRNVLK